MVTNFFLVMRTFKICSLNNFQIFNTELLTSVTGLHVRDFVLLRCSCFQSHAHWYSPHRSFSHPFLSFPFSFFTGWIVSEAVLWPTAVCGCLLCWNVAPEWKPSWLYCSCIITLYFSDHYRYWFLVFWLETLLWSVLPKTDHSPTF